MKPLEKVKHLMPQIHPILPGRRYDQAGMGFAKGGQVAASGVFQENDAVVFY
jgi:hypothetical protein